MPSKELEHDDPFELRAIELPGTDGSTREMAEVFAEEFARDGFHEEAILRLFRDPFYLAAHGALKRLGEEEVRRIVREAVEVWSPPERGNP